MSFKAILTEPNKILKISNAVLVLENSRELKTDYMCTVIVLLGSLVNVR